MSRSLISDIDSTASDSDDGMRIDNSSDDSITYGKDWGFKVKKEKKTI